MNRNKVKRKKILKVKFKKNLIAKLLKAHKLIN